MGKDSQHDYNVSEKGQERYARYRGSIKGVLNDVRWSIERKRRERNQEDHVQGT